VLLERAVNRSTARAISPQDRTVYVEQNNFHSTATTDARPGSLVSNNPPTIQAPPAIC
jgi:hypothetical protein